MDNLTIWHDLKDLREGAWLDAKICAEALGINTPKAITCVKPSGTVSQLVGVSSGIHPRHSPYYLRRVRVSASDPVARFLISEGVPYFPEVGQEKDNANTLVFEFPQASPEGAVYRADINALDQLNGWLQVKLDWCDHNPSCTIYVKEHEWLEVGAWIYRNWDFIGGLSFLPFDGGVYELAPYEEIDKETHDHLVQAMPSINWAHLSAFESNDNTEGAKTYACTGDKCEIP